MNANNTTGVVFLHSAPKALCPHIEWALGETLGTERVAIQWADQPAAPGSVRGEFVWAGPAGTGPLLASSLRGWSRLRYEVTENASPGIDGGRWSYTPQLGIWHGQTDAAGNIVVTEDRIREALETADNPSSFAQAMNLVLGTAWDAELEAFRCAGEGAAVTWLHHVG